MCLAIPCKIIEIDNSMAVIDVAGVKGEACLLLIEDPKVGEYVIVHAGFAIQKLDEKEAMASLKVLHEVASLAADTDGRWQP
ncbi:MAG: HypC/HybG/HupF family hydrogenase formation chaperone [Pseudomonadota bacterium]